LIRLIQLQTATIIHLMTRDKMKMPSFDGEEIKQAALSLISRYGSKKKAERAAMHRQFGAGPSTPGVYYWGAVAKAIRKMK
jgi:hypothetical protein